MFGADKGRADRLDGKELVIGIVQARFNQGVTNVLAGRSRRPATRALFTHAAQIYAGRHSDADGRIRATFSLVWMSGWAPADSQRKPLRPGSAQVSLARVLEDPEG